ncbi:MAG: tRNA-binding protein [Bacteroidales bacterium]
MATIEDFNKLDIRVGMIIDVRPFPKARKPAYILTIDFGKEIGQKKSSAQLVDNYKEEQLLHKKVMAVVNFPPRQIGPMFSEVLTLGVTDKLGKTVLISPETDVPLGAKLS